MLGYKVGTDVNECKSMIGLGFFYTLQYDTDKLKIKCPILNINFNKNTTPPIAIKYHKINLKSIVK